MRQELFRGLAASVFVALFGALFYALPANSQQINLQTQVTGQLPPANGGTGIDSSLLTGCPKLTGGVWTVNAANCVSGSAVNVNGVTVSSPNFINGGGFTWNVNASNITLGTPPAGQCFVGIGGLVGAFTDGSGVIKQALCIGNGPSSFVVPSGATQLLLGVDDDKYVDNTGSFAVSVSVNGGSPSSFTVPGTAMPWSVTTNPSYSYGVNDGTSGVVTVTSLSAGGTVSVSRTSGTVAVGSGQPAFDGNGNPANLTGSSDNGVTGTYFPTRYMSSTYTSGAITALTGDVAANGPGSAAATVNGIKGKVVPALASGYLHYNGSAFVFDTPSGIGYPAGSGIPVVTGGTAWGTTLTPTTLGSFLSGQAGCATPGYAWVPADEQCEASGGGGGTPVGPNTAVQFNNAGAFGGDSTFTFNSTTKVLQANGYATGAATAGYFDLVQNATAAPAQPAGSIRMVAPASGVTSWSETPPLAAPSAPSVKVVPAGGGQDTWLQLNGTTGLFGGLISTPTLAGTGLTTAWNHAAGFAATNVSTGIELADSASVASGDHVEGQLMAYPSTAYTATALFSVAPQAINFLSFGIGIANTTTGPAMWFGAGVGLNGPSSGAWAYAVFGCATPTSCGTNESAAVLLPVPAFVWLRLKDDGTNITYFISTDGIFFTQLYTVAKASSFLGSSGFNYLGVEIDTATTVTTHPWGTTLLSWEITTP